MSPTEILATLELLGLDWFRSYTYFTLIAKQANEMINALPKNGQGLKKRDWSLADDNS